MRKRDAALPGGQRLAEQGGSRFPGLDQDGTGPRPRALVESGKRDDVAAATTPRLTHAGPVPGDGTPYPEVGLQTLDPESKKWRTRLARLSVARLTILSSGNGGRDARPPLACRESDLTSVFMMRSCGRRIAALRGIGSTGPRRHDIGGPWSSRSGGDESSRGLPRSPAVPTE